jgi:hypothetical protein
MPGVLGPTTPGSQPSPAGGGKRRPGLIGEPRPKTGDYSYYFFFAAFLTFFTAFLTAFLTFFLAAIFLTSFC